MIRSQVRLLHVGKHAVPGSPRSRSHPYSDSEEREPPSLEHAEELGSAWVQSGVRP